MLFTFSDGNLCTTTEGLCNTVVGVLGGGQLGRMLCQAASPMGLKVDVLDPLPYAPAGRIAHRHEVGFPLILSTLLRKAQQSAELGSQLSVQLLRTRNGKAAFTAIVGGSGCRMDRWHKQLYTTGIFARTVLYVPLQARLHIGDGVIPGQCPTLTFFRKLNICP